ncbi:hypothetical protein CC86DRAFT_62050 [Ophiobolus disseminans]|uniref:Uncharacterized protein n=1 Tax=Ophiobolus disseminans TaxID=1469910 RepID=A0A6A6ZUC4_9PLEO|nr:hypothetical protein CC86DRAFT_62050 [Ophiobolus disseminans]
MPPQSYVLATSIDLFWSSIAVCSNTSNAQCWIPSNPRQHLQTPPDTTSNTINMNALPAGTIPTASSTIRARGLICLRHLMLIQMDEAQEVAWDRAYWTTLLEEHAPTMYQMLFNSWLRVWMAQAICDNWKRQADMAFALYEAEMLGTSNRKLNLHHSLECVPRNIQC